jgi:hypothetical protein
MADEGGSMPNEINEDLIEATIRRVAESKAARVDASVVEMPVAESVAPAIARADAEGASSEAGAVAARVAALVPARKPEGEDEDDEIAPSPQSLRAQMQGLPGAPMRMAGSKPAPKPAPVQKAPPWPERNAVPREQDEAPADIAAQLQTISRRLDAVLPLLERIAGSREASPARGEWERTPQATRAPITVMRGTPAPAAAGERTEPDVIDTRPIPKPLPPLIEPKRGLDLLPRNYRITVEDKRGGVDLVPLHRSMLGMDGVRDMSLLSYNNGVAIVALETTEEIDPELLRSLVSRAMVCDARIEVHNENTMVVKLSDE